MLFSIKISFICLGIATCMLGLGYGLEGLGFWAVFFGLLFMAGYLGWRKKWRLVLPGVLFLEMAIACLGILVRVSPAWMIAGFVFAFSAWDLEKLTQRIMEILDRPDMVMKIEHRYVRWLAIVNGIGLLLAEIVLLIRIKLGFGVLFITGILLILALSRLAAGLRQSRP